MKTILTQSATKILIIFISALLLTQTSFAYLSVSETAELLKPSDYRAGFIPQLLLTNGGGSNVSAFFDMPIADEINSRFIVGSGETDFWMSASAKWVPYPDYEKQPAMGIRGSFIYARERSDTFYNFQITPIISKIVYTNWGKMNPYIGLPITFVTGSNSSTLMQFAVGSEWIERKDFQAGAELDFNLSNTTTALTLHFNFPFDGNIGFRQ